MSEAPEQIHLKLGNGYEHEWHRIVTHPFDDHPSTTEYVRADIAEAAKAAAHAAGVAEGMERAGAIAYSVCVARRHVLIAVMAQDAIRAAIPKPPAEGAE